MMEVPIAALPENEDAPIVSLRGTTLAYPSAEGDVQVLNGVDFEVGPGEIVALTGPSGSGKSSLIAVIGGLERPTGGQTQVLGRDMATIAERERTHLRRREIGVVFQSYHLVPAMTAVQNVALPLMLSGARDARRAAADMLQRVGLGHRLSHRPTALSGGEQQRVAVARAFIAEPALVLADEPTGNLDQKTGGNVAELMFDLTRKAGAAMLLVTHDPALAQECDRVLAIDNGRIVGSDG